jgi:WhiB family transcriptional regulator, redox-sensing transcriptional regulator
MAVSDNDAAALLARVAKFANANGFELQRKIENTRNRHCRDIGQDVFFPLEGGCETRVTKAHRKAITEICTGCPVRDECLAGALLRKERHGSWGGVPQPDYVKLLPIWNRARKQSAA